MNSFVAVLTTIIVLSFSALGQDMMSRKDQMDSIKVEKPMTHKHHKEAAKVDTYTCPMHSEVLVKKPGTCPKCGMTLVKVDAKKVKEAPADIYTCVMHPEVSSDKPGKCSKCGMDLVKEKKDK